MCEQTLSLKIFYCYQRPSGFVFESEVIIKAAQVGIYSYSVPIPAVYKEDYWQDSSYLLQ
jgi:hypothetical protein